MKLRRIITSPISQSFTLSAVCALAVVACGGGGGGGSGTAGVQQTVNQFTDHALVVDNMEVVATAMTVDANLKNPWGIAIATGLPFWIADNNSNVATLYSGTGQVQTQAVTGSATTGISIPASAAGVPANPTGQVFNGTGGFMIMTSSGLETALFIFSGEGGTIAAWAQTSGAAAVTAFDDGIVNGPEHAVYKGLALGSVSGANYLYATDLHNNKVDVFDTNFAKPAAMQGKFVDPGLPAGFAPFGITAVNGQLFVTFAMQDAAKHDEMTGAGLGYVDIFDMSGNFVSRFASAGPLNAPWGIAVAPAGFATLQGQVLVGNFGDGTINAFMPNGTSLATSTGPLMNSAGQPLAFAGLWSLVFGNGDSDKPVDTLFYTAGFASQTDGVFGSITASTMMVSTGY
ncbi:MAG TPA: TIGR03118 family protein [Steroidobacteraceae bacterium]|nr:TIGR03118 family protein [Steroidobacteraceae bacterium]